MKKIFLFFCLISLIISKGPYQKDNDVLILTDKTFAYALREFKYLLILFYDPECPHCKNFMPEYIKMASLLKEENFVFAKLDCIKYENIEKVYEIEAYPTLMLIKGDDKIIFEGERTMENIKKWLEEKTKPNFEQINTKEELDSFSKNKLCMVYFGNNETTINNIILAERIFEKMPLGIVSKEDLIKSEYPKENNDKEYIKIFKNFDENKTTLNGPLSYKKILKFVNTYSYPKVMEFNEETSPIIFAKKQPALVIFGSKSGEDNMKTYKDNFNLLLYMWPQIKDTIRLFFCDIDKLTGKQLAVYCGITYDNIPKVFIVQSEGEIPKRFEMTEEINEENILNFLNKWQKGELTPYIRSEPIPDSNDEYLVKLVGYNFQKEVFENDKDILLYFVSSWCQRCVDFMPKLINLSKKLNKINNKIIFAKIDATLNDVDDFQIHNFPSIFLYPGNAKDKEPIEFKGRKNNIESIEKFILKHAYHKYINEEKNPEL